MAQRSPRRRAVSPPDRILIKIVDRAFLICDRNVSTGPGANALLPTHTADTDDAAAKLPAPLTLPRTWTVHANQRGEAKSASSLALSLAWLDLLYTLQVTCRQEPGRKKSRGHRLVNPCLLFVSNPQRWYARRGATRQRVGLPLQTFE